MSVQYFWGAQTLHNQLCLNTYWNDGPDDEPKRWPELLTRGAFPPKSYQPPGHVETAPISWNCTFWLLLYLWRIASFMDSCLGTFSRSLSSPLLIKLDATPYFRACLRSSFAPLKTSNSKINVHRYLNSGQKIFDISKDLDHVTRTCFSAGTLSTLRELRHS